MKNILIALILVTLLSCSKPEWWQTRKDMRIDRAEKRIWHSYWMTNGSYYREHRLNFFY